MAKSLASRCLVSLWLGLMLYGILSLLVGPGGILASAAISERSEAMRSNLEALKATNQALGAELEALRFDRDRAEREARALGFLPRGGYEVVLAGRESTGAALPSAGITLAAQDPASLSDSQIKAIAGTCAVLALLVSLASLKSASRPGPRAEFRRPRTERFPSPAS